MTKYRLTYRLCIALLLCLVQTAGIAVYGQNRPRAAAKRTHQLQGTDTLRVLTHATDSMPLLRVVVPDSALVEAPATAADSIAVADSLAEENRRKLLEMTAPPRLQEQPVNTDSLSEAVSRPTWVPNPVKATWMALVIPGGGQIYNRKYWKLPIFYGGFAGCAYALTWNSKMYTDYANAYKDAVNENWTSSNITDLVSPGYLQVVSKSQLTETLRKRKDTFRRYRDLSIFAFIGVYLLSVVDAYVDAELSNFDIGPDLSMHVEPAVIDNSQVKFKPDNNRAVGLQCSFRF